MEEPPQTASIVTFATSVVARTTLTDAFRSIGVGQGTAPFAQHQTGLGRFLVTSTFMRVGYTVAKATTFCGLALAQALSGYPAGTVPAGLMPSMISGFQLTAWTAVFFCVLRGVPVVAHAVRHFWFPASVVTRAEAR